MKPFQNHVFYATALLGLSCVGLASAAITITFSQAATSTTIGNSNGVGIANQGSFSMNGFLLTWTGLLHRRII